MIALKDGLYWPKADTQCRPSVLEGLRRDVPQFLAHVTGRACVVQAGANAGLYPIALAAHFERVVTVEPDLENFCALRENVERSGLDHRIDFRRAAFGEKPGLCDIEHLAENNCGAHRVTPGERVAVITIDGYGLTECDAIWLDIEGYELAALRGAERTIERRGPVIAIEEKGLSEHFGVARGEAPAWLEARGYRLVDQIGRDQVFKRGGQ